MPPALSPSPIVIVTLLIILGASVGVFVMLVRRETLRHRWLAISQWAKSRGLRAYKAADSGRLDSPALKPFLPYHPRPQTILEGKRLAIVQAATDPPATLATATPRWNLLILQLNSTWSPTGLRPAAHHLSILDLFALSSFPSLATSQKFMVFGNDSTAARFLAESPAATLLPPDIGLLLHGQFLILDFTSRHFDPIEFGRMIDLADQLASPLEIPATSKSQ